MILLINISMINLMTIPRSSSNASQSSGHLRRRCASAVFQMRSKRRDFNPNNNSLTRKLCCKRRMESLICRCLFSYLGIILRVRVHLFTSDQSSNQPVANLVLWAKPEEASWHVRAKLKTRHARVRGHVGIWPGWGPREPEDMRISKEPGNTSRHKQLIVFVAKRVDTNTVQICRNWKWNYKASRFSRHMPSGSTHKIRVFKRSWTMVS